MGPDRNIEGIEGKLDAQSGHLKGSPLLYKAFYEVATESGPETPLDARYARAANT
jgi:hypothetical protein